MATANPNLKQAETLSTTRRASFLTTGLPLPLWLKDYAGLGLLTVALFGMINLDANDAYSLQILCSIGVAIIVATGLNLIVGYIGQVALGQAGFVALGGYMVGLITGHYTSNNNWIDYLYVYKVAGFEADEQKNAAAAIAKRKAALEATNNLLLTITICVIVLTVGLGIFFWLRWQHVRRSGGVAEAHFWQKAALMKNLTRVILGIGAVGAIIIYIITVLSRPTGKLSEGIPWILFATWAISFAVLYYLSDRTATRATADSGQLRVSFWDRPTTVRAFFLTTVIGGGLLTLLGILFYTVGFWLLQNFWATLLLGIGVTAAFGYLLALPALRVKGPYLSMVTIAFGTIVYEIANSSTLQPLLGAQGGLSRIPYPVTERDPKTDLIYPSLSQAVNLQQLFWTAIITAAAAVLTVYLVRSFMRTRWGRSLIAIRENEIGAGSVGINVTRTKTLAFVMSAASGGVGGVLFAYSFNQIDPTVSLLSVSIGYVTMLILGGSGTLYGPILGAVLITLIPEFLKNFKEGDNARYVFALDGLNGYLTPLVLLGLVILYLVARQALKNERLAYLAGLAAGLVVVLNSYEVFKSLTNALGSLQGIGFAKVNFDPTDWLIIAFYYVMIVAGLVITIKTVRLIAVRTLAAVFILFIPTFYKLGEGFVSNSNAPEFRPVGILLSMYGAILLYFLYLVPNGIGGLLGRYIDRFFPTSHKIKSPASRQTASADGSEPELSAATPRRTLAFHRSHIDKSEQLLKIAHVSRNFKGLRAVDSVEMQLNDGTVHALIGPNGAGKTTMLNLISGLYPVSSGEILFKGQRIDGLKAHRIAETGISRTFQNLQVFGDMTVIENVMVGFHLHTRQGFWASLVGLPQVRLEESRIEALAMELLQFVGLESRAYNKARDLPYGYQRLLEIARALAVEPQILLLDEPAAGLNPQEVEEMVRLIRKIKTEGVSVLLIEHHMDLVMEISDEITVLDYGKKIEEGNPVHVQNSPRVKEAYFGPEVVLDARS